MIGEIDSIGVNLYDDCECGPDDLSRFPSVRIHVYV
jgi:hypothetical protein